MATIKNNKILILLIILLLVTNTTTIVGIIIHLKNDEFAKSNVVNDTSDITNMRRGQFFKQKLDLSTDQTFIFRDLHHEYKADASLICLKIDDTRKEMINELSLEKSDSLKLNVIANNIGDLHTQLKGLTINYFLDMKKNCNNEQKEELYKVFNSLLNEQGDVRMPMSQQERGFGYNRNNRFNNNTQNN